MRFVVLPGAFVMLCFATLLGVTLWSTFHSSFVSDASPELAYSGNIPAQRKLASCYQAGCHVAPRDPAFACAWRQIIVSETAYQTARDIAAARATCSQLLPNAKSTVLTLEGDIRYQMREINDHEKRDYGRQSDS